MADVLSFPTQFQGDPPKSDKVSDGENPGVWFVFNIAEATNLKADFMTTAHLSAFGEPTTFCIVRYGQQEYRTDVCRETSNPKWAASFCFEHDPAAREVLFLFFSEDPTTQISDLFGHIVVPLPEAEVPTNAVYMKDVVPIVRCDHRALHLLRDAEANEQTWPTISPVISGTFKGEIAVGKVSVQRVRVITMPHRS